MSRDEVLSLAIAKLDDELATLTRAAKESFAAATDPDSKAENKYDTRTLEASYVARGQAQRVAELQEALHRFQALVGSDASEVIALGSLITLLTTEESIHCFVGPAAGGTQVECEGNSIDVITPASPMGQKLMGKGLDATIELGRGVLAKIAEIQ